MAGSAVEAAAVGGTLSSLTMASMTLSGTPARLSLISPSVLVSNFRDADRIFWMITDSGRPAFTMPTTLSLVSTSWAEAGVPPATASGVLESHDRSFRLAGNARRGTGKGLTGRFIGAVILILPRGGRQAPPTLCRGRGWSCALGHLALDDDLDQMRTFGRDGSRQGARQVARCRDALRRDPEPAGEIEEAKPRLPQIHVKVGAIGLGPETLPVHVHVVLEDAVLAVA